MAQRKWQKKLHSIFEYVKNYSRKSHSQSKTSGIFQDRDVLKVKVHAPAEKGKANKEVITMLSEYFSVQKSAVILLEGKPSHHKVFRIED